VSSSSFALAHHASGGLAQVHGATEAEVAEALGVAVLMDGGPGTVYDPAPFAAFREFASTAAPAAATI
jgi:hypothetical protein